MKQYDVIDRDEEQRLSELIREAQAAIAADCFPSILYRKLCDLLPHESFVYGTVDVSRSQIVSFVSYVSPDDCTAATHIARDRTTCEMVKKWLNVLEPIFFEPRMTLPKISQTGDLNGSSALSQQRDWQVRNIALHGMVDIRRQMASCFIFAGIERPWDRRTKSIIRSVVPYLHSVLTAVTCQEMFASTQTLSRRENDVLGLMTRGRTDAQIAEKLGISVYTVRIHVRSILRKTNACNRTQAVAKALRSQLVD